MGMFNVQNEQIVSLQLKYCVAHYHMSKTKTYVTHSAPQIVLSVNLYP